MNVTPNIASIDDPPHPGLPDFVNFEAVTLCVDDLLSLIGDERKERIFRLRLGLEDGQMWTLEKIGHDLGISRERTRQLQVQAQRKLSDTVKQARPAHLDHCETLFKDFGDRIGADMKDGRFAQALSTLVGVDLAIVSAHIRVFLLILGDIGTDRTPLHEFDLCVIRALAENKGNASFDELARAIRENPDVSEELGEWPKFSPLLRLELLLGVKVDGNGLRAAPEQVLSKLSSREHRLIALSQTLREAGKPLHFRDIARQMKQLLPDTLAMSERNVHAWMDRYKDRFKWVGPGTFGLREWDIGARDVRLDSNLKPARRRGIGDEIALFLSESNKPILLEEIEEHILGRFEVNRTSVSAAVVQDKARRFELLQDGKVALAMWRGRTETHPSLEGPVPHAIPRLKRRVRLAGELRDKARSAARRRVSEVNTLVNRGRMSIPGSKAAGFAVVAAALGMTNEFQVLIRIAEQNGMPHSMVGALKDLSE